MKSLTLPRAVGRYRAPLGLAALLAALAGAPVGAQTAADCARTVGAEARAIGKAGQSGQDKCQGLAHKIGVSGGLCNDVTGLGFTLVNGGKYEISKEKSLARLHGASGKCPASGAEAVTGNYPGGLFTNKISSIEQLLTNRATVALGAADLDRNLARLKCHKIVSAARTSIADKMMTTAMACQKSQAPGAPLAAACRDDAKLTGLIRSRDLGIKKACVDAGISGTEVGSCDPLFVGVCSTTSATACNRNADCPEGETCISNGTPSQRGCVSQIALAEGKNLADIAYPNPVCTGTAVPGDRTATISLASPVDLSGVTVTLNYPKFDVSLVGNGDLDTSAWTFTADFLSAFDLDGSVRISALASVPFGSGVLAAVPFDVCRPLLPEGTCSVTTSQSCTANGNCRPPSCGSCLANNSETCVPQGRVCSVSQYLGCTASPECPASETCVSQRSLTFCTVEAAADENGNPVEGVTCSVSLTE